MNHQKKNSKICNYDSHQQSFEQNSIEYNPLYKIKNVNITDTMKQIQDEFDIYQNRENELQKINKSQANNKIGQIKRIPIDSHMVNGRRIPSQQAKKRNTIKKNQNSHNNSQSRGDANDLNSTHYKGMRKTNEFNKNTLPPSGIQKLEPSKGKKSICQNNINVDGYTLQETLGSGSYAFVKLALDKTTKQQVAIKIYEKYKLLDAQKKKNVEREIAILTKIDHPNCIRLIQIIENHRAINVVMEFIGIESLHSYLKKTPSRKLPEDEAQKIFKQIISALHYLHENNIIHRDIKLENILFDPLTKKIKIIDFGFAIVCNIDKKLTTICGTPSYMAPEICQKKDYLGPPVDVWSAGIALYTMLCGYFPFRGTDDRNLYYKIMKGQFQIPDDISQGAQQVLRKVLLVDPQQRPTTSQILKDTWINPINIQSQLQQLRKYVLMPIEN